MIAEFLRTVKSEFWWTFRKAQLSRENDSIVEPGARVKFDNNLKLGRNVKIGSGALIHCGENHIYGGKQNVSIGDKSYIGPNSVIFGEGGVEIGKYCEIAPGVVITSQQHTFESIKIPIKEQVSELKKVVIEDDVWIGCNASVLPGVTIGRGAVIGAGAVVNRDIPAYSVAVGVPAKVIKGRVRDEEFAVK